MRTTMLRVCIPITFLAMAACGTSAGGGGGTFQGPKQTVAAGGSACVPASMVFGCLVGGNVLMSCDPADSLWKKSKDCAVGEICTEGIETGTNKNTAQCAVASYQDAGSTTDAGPTGDTAGADSKLPPVDAGGKDGGVVDGGPTDTGPKDAGPTDTGPKDTGPTDTGPKDTGSKDTAPADTGPADAGGLDVDTPDVKPDPVDTNIPQPSITCPSGKSKTSTYGEHTITYGVTTGPGGDDIMHGSLQWKNGSTIITKGCWKNNKMYGHWSAWHAANAAKSTQFYYNALGKMSGMQRSWYEAGGKYFEGVFKNGERIGLIQRWHEDGTLRDKVWFDAKGELHGLFQSWHENGAKDLVQTFIHGKAQGLTQGWFDKGQKAFEGAWDKGLEEGVHTDWHEAGGISGKNTYSKGNGDVKLSHENGKPAVVGSRKDGERHGVWNWWDDKGNKLFHVEFTLGSGPFTEWFENGKIRRQGTYKEEQRHGPYKEWADTGNLVSDGSYFEGSQHGSWTFYDDKGAKAYTLCIVHGSITRFEPCTSGMLN